MDVARAVLDGLIEHQVDEFDDGVVVGEFLRGRVVLRGLRDFLDIVGTEVLEDVVEIFRLGVILLDELNDGDRIADDHVNFPPDDVAQFVNQRGIQRIGKDHAHRVAVGLDGQALIHLGRRGVDDAEHLRRHDDVL